MSYADNLVEVDDVVMTHSMEWTLLAPGFTIPGTIPPMPPLCGYGTKNAFGWHSICDQLASVIRIDEDGYTDYACRDHSL